MVFDPKGAPAERDAFMCWYNVQTQWEEPHTYDDPEICSPALKAWFLEIIETFPPMNGKFASAELPEDEACATDYSVGKKMIYGAFAWSKMDPAYELVFDLAEKHGVGFFDVSGKGNLVWVPDPEDGKLTVAHADES